ncbi:MAG: HEPN domain-containing protein [Patescibacteria group bacterium]|jgi:HEPN domain-containing protein
MLKQDELLDLAKTRFAEARVLHENGKHDGAVYLCGYAIELALKWVILKDKLWGFPDEPEEFKLYEEVKTHDLEKLLTIANRQQMQNDRVFSIPWGYIKNWRSEFRYRPIGMVKEVDSSQMLSSVDAIMKALGVA